MYHRIDFRLHLPVRNAVHHLLVQHPGINAFTWGRISEASPFKTCLDQGVNKNHLITNLPAEACVEVPCLVDGYGVHPCHVGALPVQCAAMNMTNINVQLLTIEAAVTGKKEHIYQAAMLDPHTGSELDIDTIKKMVDDLIEAHGDYLPKFN